MRPDPRCHGCRRCVSLCDAYPTLFDLVDESETMEVDGVAIYRSGQRRGDAPADAAGGPGDQHRPQVRRHGRLELRRQPGDGQALGQGRLRGDPPTDVVDLALEIVQRTLADRGESG